VEPALSDEVEAAVLRPDEASVDNRLLAAALLEAAKRAALKFSPALPFRSIWREGSRCRGFTLAAENRSSRATRSSPQGCFSSQITGSGGVRSGPPGQGPDGFSPLPKPPKSSGSLSERVYLVPRNDGRILAGATVEHVGFDKTVHRARHSRQPGRRNDSLPFSPERRSKKPGLAFARHARSFAIIGPRIWRTDSSHGTFSQRRLLTPITARLVGDFVLERRQA
jgi:glycine/D-amino acid oxidase-like deaminating enzyme